VVAKQTNLSGSEVLPPLVAESEPVVDVRVPAPTAQRRQATDRFTQLNTFVDQRLRELQRSELAVWLILYRDARNGIAQTGQTDIARRAGIRRRTVVRAIAQLIERGLIELVERGTRNGSTSRYRVLV
jgi:DNA-binding MarR family transcriptional regulator